MPITVHSEPASSGEGEGAELMQKWKTHVAIPIGNRYLCFVDYLRGMLLCDITGMNTYNHRPLKLRYVPLPGDNIWSDKGRQTRNVAAAGANTVRLVTVDPRCCCGGPGRTWCVRGRFAFTVTAWTLSLMEEEDELSSATWVKDGVLDCEDVWGFPGYGGIPKVSLEYPIVSAENPDVVCFIVCENHYAPSEEMKVWIVEVNVRTKELISTMPRTTDPWRANYHIAARLRWYLIGRTGFLE